MLALTASEISGKAPQITRNRSSIFFVCKHLLPSRLGALQQERSSIFFSKHVEFDRLDRGAPVGNARGDDHLPTLELRKRFLDFSCGFRRVGVIENQKPAGILAEPAEHGGQAHDFLGLILFGQVKNRRLQSAARFARKSTGERALTKSSAV